MQPPGAHPLARLGAAGGGAVRVVTTAKGQAKSVSVDPSLMNPDEKEILEDLRTGHREAAFNGPEAALKTSARPGHSEHQLGTALDFRSADGPPAWELPDWQKTSEGAWLAENGPRFGFVMSYPAGQEAVTCYSYEPWHYRYVGRDAAAELVESGLTLREWLWTR